MTLAHDDDSSPAPALLGLPDFLLCRSEFVTPELDRIVGYFDGLFEGEPLPKDGFIDLPERPGFGVTLVRDNLVRPYPRTAEESAAQAAVNHERPPPTKAHMPL